MKAKTGQLLNTSVDLIPGTPVKKTITGIHADAAGLEDMEVLVTAPDGSMLMDYHRPDSKPGGNVTPFAKDLQNAPIPPDKMTAEQLVLAAIFKQKEMNIADATNLAKLALKRRSRDTPTRINCSASSNSIRTIFNRQRQNSSRPSTAIRMRMQAGITLRPARLKLRPPETSGT